MKSLTQVLIKFLFSFSHDKLPSVRINVENEDGQRVVNAETSL